MRKLAPAFLLSSIVALSCGSAFALGDMNKSKKSPSATTTASTDAVNPADRTYTSPTNPSSNSSATAFDTGKGGATASGSTTGAPMANSAMSNAAPKSSSSHSVSPSSSTMATDGMAVDKSKKWTDKDCQGIALTDPLYKTHHCGAMKGGPGASGGDGAGASGAPASSSSGSGK